MARVSRRSNWPLYLQIADDLRDQVLQQRLSPGQRLPSEHAMMATYQASRQTVRRAVSLLKSEGLLDTAQGQGVFVRTMAPLLRRLSPQRGHLSDGGGGFAFDLDTQQELVAEREAGQVGAPAGIASRLALREGAPVTMWRWRVFGDEQPLQLATTYLPASLQSRQVLEQPEYPEDVYSLLTRELDLRVDYLTERVVSRMPQPAEATALDLGPGTPVVLLARTAYAADGTPVETCEVTMAADRQELQYEVPSARGESTRLLASGGDLSAALQDVVHEAREVLAAVGSRSRQPAYLHAIEQALQDRPDLVHYRVLMGPPHNQALKDHLLRLLEIRAPGQHSGAKTLYIGMVDDLTEDPEVFFVANEITAVVTLPSINTPGNFDTGLLITDPGHAHGLLHHAKALYGKKRLETPEAVNELPVLR